MSRRAGMISLCETAVVEAIVAYNNPKGVIREAFRWFQLSKANGNERGIFVEELIGKSREDMPTKPLQTVLYRELAKAQIQEIFAPITPLLQELVNNGTNVLIRCVPTKGIEREDIAPLYLYRHILEMTDAFEVLISEGCAAPTVPILRSTFEALLSLDYILELDEKYAMRSLSWYAQDIRSRIKILELVLPKTGRGQKFQASLQFDKTLNGAEDLQEVFANEDEVQKMVDGLHALLTRPEFSPIEAEFNILREKKWRDDWFCLFGGPGNRFELAHHLKRNAQYDFLYRQWSGIAHASDASPFIVRMADGRPGIRGIRDPKPITEVIMFSVVFMIEATRLMLRKFRPGESFANYYLAEIRENFLKVRSISKAIREQSKAKRILGK